MNLWSNLAGGGPRRRVHPHADVSDGLPALLPDVGSQFRRPDADAEHTVCSYASYRCVGVSVCVSVRLPTWLRRFGTHVSGGDTVSRAVRINNPTFMGN